MPRYKRTQWEIVKDSFNNIAMPAIHKTYNATKTCLAKGGKKVRDSALLLRQLSPRENFQLKYAEPYLSSIELQYVKNLIKQNKLHIKLEKQDWSFLVSGKNLLPRLVSSEKEVRELNVELRKNFMNERYKEFANKAWNSIPQYIAPNTLGILDAKQAASLQLFVPEPVHVLLQGQNADATDLLRSMNFLTLKTTSLSNITRSDNKNCIFCTDVSTLTKPQHSLLLSAVDANKLGKDTKASVLAFAKSERNLKNFHLVLKLKQAKLNYFADIADKLIAGSKTKINHNDILFVKMFVRYASDIKTTIPPHLAEKVKQFVLELKRTEAKLHYDVTPQTIKGVVNLVKASARMELRDEVVAKDLARVFELYKPLE